MKWKKVKENNIHSKEQLKYSTFFLLHFCFTYTYKYFYLSSMPHRTLSHSIHPSLPPLRPFFFSTCLLCALKGSWGVLFLHRKTFDEFDGYHTKANTELGEEEEKDKSFISTQLEIHKMLYKKNCL